MRLVDNVSRSGAADRETSGSTAGHRRRAGPCQRGLGIEIGLLAGIRPHRGACEHQKRAERVEDPVEAADRRGPNHDHGDAWHPCAANVDRQHPLLEFLRHGEVSAQRREHEHVVASQGLLDEAARDGLERFAAGRGLQLRLGTGTAQVLITSIGPTKSSTAPRRTTRLWLPARCPDVHPVSNAFRASRLRVHDRGTRQKALNDRVIDAAAVDFACTSSLRRSRPDPV